MGLFYPISLLVILILGLCAIIISRFFDFFYQKVVLVIFKITLPHKPVFSIEKGYYHLLFMRVISDCLFLYHNPPGILLLFFCFALFIVILKTFHKTQNPVTPISLLFYKSVISIVGKQDFIFQLPASIEIF